MSEIVLRAWRDWSQAAIPPGASLQQRVSMKTAFYSGAATILGMVLRAPEEEQSQLCADIGEELTEFSSTLAAGRGAQ